MDEVGYIVEWSDSLGPPWDDQGVAETIVADNGVIQNVKASVPAGSVGRRFIRLRVVQEL
jgi:putative heme iron utilization protein